MLSTKKSLALGLTLVLSTAFAAPVKAEVNELNTQSQQQNSSLQKATETNLVCIIVPIRKRVCI
jgi:hypothetical protein